jgi:hypothetical protein
VFSRITHTILNGLFYHGYLMIDVLIDSLALGNDLSLSSSLAVVVG